MMLIGIVLLFVLPLLLLLGLSIAIAFLLHWLLPAVSLEMALLAAVLAVGQAMLLYGRLIDSSSSIDEPQTGIDPRSVLLLDPDLPLPRRRRKR